jgi:manganese-dependent inorganic pyrophosphatase
MIYVVGHRNPDTDTIASALGYAWLLRERDGDDTIAARVGSVNQQTHYALNYFDVEEPVLLEDASPRFEAIVSKVQPLAPETPLSEAWRMHAQTKRPAPVVDRFRNPVGMVTGQSVFEYLSQRLDMTDAPFSQLINVPSGEACDLNVPKFLATDRIVDQRDSVLRSDRDDFWVVSHNGKYIGTCTRADMMKPPKLKLVLVDHNEANQAVGGLNEAEVLEVLDHHRIGTINTTIPIAFHVDTVGSCSTLVSERMRMARLTPPPGIAGMLLSGLLSDTLAFKSPTSTPRDRASATWLAWHAFGVDDADIQLKKYADELLRAGADLSGRSAQDIVATDYKAYESGGIKFGVAQVEVTNFMAITERLDEVRAALRALADQRGLSFAALMITDIIENNSLLVCAGDNKHYERLPFSRKGDALWDLPGVVSRKKQLLPTLLGMLQG